MTVPSGFPISSHVYGVSQTPQISVLVPSSQYNVPQSQTSQTGLPQQ